MWFLGVLVHYDKVYVLFVSEQGVNTRPSLWVLLALRKLFYIIGKQGRSFRFPLWLINLQYTEARINSSFTVGFFLTIPDPYTKDISALSKRGNHTFTVL